MSAPRPTPFRRLLVANRGEIALRVMRTARAMGLETVAVHSRADRDAAHVRAADFAVDIGPAAPRESYLNIAAILSAAAVSGAEAIHPGYGFLSENPDFSEACAAAGLVFVGPSAAAIRAMGDKASAKAAMTAAGVPCVPGHDGTDQSEAALTAAARDVGFPLMIKAVAGGGGRGMRLVEAAADFPAALSSARSEAMAGFGDDRVLLERAILRPRHVEIQVFGDRYGAAVHMGERDCSVQRRHQKVLEEAPSPAVAPALREAMGAASVAAAKAIGYEGAGTLEFLLDDAGGFHFMEMNTRLQVEHPVTEAITGLDLVEWQLRVAMGEPLPLAQSDIRLTGHAIEARLCAEDPEAGFLPQTGRVALWSAPTGLRVETALETGAEISPHYDSMAAKLIATGPTREAARLALIAGLERTAVPGLATNRGFLVRALAHPDFAAGEARTDFCPRLGTALTDPDPDAAEALAPAAALLVLLTAAPLPAEGFRAHPLAHGFAAPIRFAMGGATREAAIERDRATGDWSVTLGDAAPEPVAVVSLTPGAAALRWRGRTARLAWARDGARIWISAGSVDLALTDLAHAPAKTAEDGADDGVLRASMTGQVAAVHAAPGETVAPNAPLVTLEAMKMEHVQRLRGGGQVAEMLVSKGDQVSAGQVLARLAPQA